MFSGLLFLAAFTAVLLVLLVFSVPAPSLSSFPSVLSTTTTSNDVQTTTTTTVSISTRPQLRPKPSLVAYATSLPAAAVASKPPTGGLLAHVLQRSVQYRGVLLVTFVDGTAGSHEQVVNLVLSLHRVGMPVNVTLALCQDEVSSTYLKARGINAFHVARAVWEGEIGMGTSERPHNTAAVYYLLLHGINVLVVDSDVVLVRRRPNGIDAAIDLFTSYASGATHIAFTLRNPPTDNVNYVYNSGFYLARASNTSLVLFESVLRKVQKAKPPAANAVGWFDDRVLFGYNFNDLLPVQRDCIIELPWFQFRASTSALWSGPNNCCTNTSLLDSWSRGWDLAHDDRDPFTLQFNLAGNDNAARVQAMKNWRLWFSDDVELIHSSGLIQTT